ncbi:hypothetical protein BDV32DRAFT_132952 [Aspergillus pseudonomiae]|nr:hypothetical protein BDV32DRAFT_132952 [Aspergillus pseudonomiae]
MQLKVAGKFGKKGHDRWPGKRIPRSISAVFLPGFCSLISLFSAMLFQLLLSYLANSVWVGRKSTVGFGKGKPRRRERFSLKHS